MFEKLGIRNPRTWLYLILILSVAMRLPYVFQESLWNDETVYMWISTKVLATPQIAAREMFPPSAYTVTIPGAILGVFMSSFDALRLVDLLYALVGIGFIYLIGKELIGEEAGIAAAILLSTNNLFYFLSTRALLDVPVTSMFVVFAWVLLKYHKQQTNLLIVMLTLFALTMTKIIGVLGAIPLVYFASYELFTKRDKKTTIKWVSLGLLFLGVFLVMNWTIYGSLLPQKYFGAIKDVDRSFYIKNSGFIFTWPVFLLAIAALFFLNSFELSLIASFFITVFLAFSLFLGWNFPRYMEPAVPFAILLAIHSVKKISEFTKSMHPYLNFRMILIALTAYLAFTSFNIGKQTIESKIHTYTGFQELGQKVAELNAQFNFSIIYTQSARQVRVFSNIEYGAYGGKIYSLPRNEEEVLNATNVLLQLDIWEYAAPKWVYPLDQQKFDKILGRGFKVIYITSREIPTQQGLQKVPVGFLLAK